MGEGTNKQTRRFPLALIILPAALILGTAAGLVVSRATAVPHTILVDGKPLVTVASNRAAKGIIESVRMGSLSGVPEESVKFNKPVSLHRDRNAPSIASTAEAEKALRDAVVVEASLFAISVGDKPIAALRSYKEADEALKLVKKHYEGKLKNLQSESRFKEDVFIAKRHVPADLLVENPEEAVKALTGVKDPAVIHTIERGDRAVKLAHQYGITMDKLKKLNPGRNFDALTEGETLFIRPATSMVTVISKALVKKTEEVTPPGRNGRRGVAGKREKQVLVVYENGQPVSEEVLSQITTWNRPKSSSKEPSRRRSRHRSRH